MSALSTSTGQPVQEQEQVPTSSSATNSNFNLPPEWVNKEMLLMRRVEYLQAAIVDLSRNAMQIITWSEMIQEGIDEMQKSISVSNLETETEPEEDEEEENGTGTTTETGKNNNNNKSAAERNRLLQADKIL